jgi:hypothetical protein
MIKLLITGFFLFFISVFLNAQIWQISNRADMPEPVTNNGLTEGFVGSVPYVYSFAGLDSTKLFSGIHLRSFRYNTLTDIWESIAPLPDTLGKIAPAASRIKDKIYIIGGYHVFASGNELSSSKVHIYDVNSNSYLPDGAGVPVPIDDHVQAVWRDSLIFVVTGWSNTGNVPNVQIYNPASDSWQSGTSVPNNNIYKSFGASGTIIGDTIYYFGGASMSGSFNIQNYFRMGIINPSNPAQISWSDFTWMNAKGYRMAATTSFGKVFWLGGSETTYNYNAIAYNGSGGVPPSGNSLCYQKANHSFVLETGYNLPMDLRGIANISDTVRFLAGGMQSGQLVSKSTLRLILNPDSLMTNIPVVEYKNPVEFNISPNPATSAINIRLFNTRDVFGYSLYSLSGVCLKMGFINSEESLVKIDNLKKGLYLFQLNDHKNNYSVIKKVIIE